MANIILKQKHISQGVLTREQSRIAAALVVLAALDDGANSLLSFRIGIITGTHIDLELDGEQILVGDDRTNAVLVDLVIGRRQPTVANQNCPSELLIQLVAHLLLQPGDHIKLGDVDNVIAIHPLLLVNGGRRGRALQQTEHLLLLEVALDVTLGPSIILGQVREGSAEPAERSMVNAVHNSTNPRLVVIQNLGRSVQLALIREQPIQLIDTMGQERILHAAIALRISDSRLNFSRVLEAVVGGIAFENIVLHRIILLIRIIFLCVFNGLTNKVVTNVLLFVGHIVIDFLDSFAFFLLFGHFCTLLFGVSTSFFPLFGMIQFKVVIVIDKCLTVCIFRMNHDIINERPGICTRKNQTHFPNIPMKNISCG